MLLEHLGKSPKIHESAYIAPNATVCGDVTLGENCRVLFGAVLTAEGGPIDLGHDTIVMENAVVRATSRHPVRVGNHVLVGPGAYLSGCIVEDHAFIATGATIFNGARIGREAEVRIHGVVHLRTKLEPGTVVPIGWVAVGRPVEILPPKDHDRIWGIQKPLDFPKEVFGQDRGPMEKMMTDLTTRYARALGAHAEDRVLDGGDE
jgi:carbonic anhydrase/acetyltransferase-like protein (isoleucine patch superfamily)